MKFLRWVFWHGKMRERKPGKPKFYNRVQWFRDEGLGSKKRIKQVLYLEKIEPLRQRLDREGIHGKKRKGILARKKHKIRIALTRHRDP